MCQKSNGLCNRCLIGEDEDDNEEEDDLSLVNPKFSKNPSANGQKLKKVPSGLSTEVGIVETK